jgi:high-affinity nickel-transport protein
MALVLSLLFGLLQGLRHAFEPDHVVAVSTMISEQRAARARIGYAAAWGIGHATTLLVVCALLMLLRAKLPARLDAAFELAVSMMLIGLGGRALRHALRESSVSQGEPHAHMRIHRHASGLPRGWRSIGPLAMGMVHGLAGSGALTALVVARLPSATAGVVFIILFGLGATVGMSLVAGVAGVPLGQLLRTRWGMPALLGVTGSVSLILGLTWLLPTATRLMAS